MRCKVFCPAHISGFFRICEKSKKPVGSKGAGICLSRGVVSTVNITHSDKQKIIVYANGKLIRADVTKFVVKKLIENEKLNVRIDFEYQLPEGQGLGISGACALSTGLGVSYALKLNLTRNDIIWIAHESEIVHHTGLGDVWAQSVGGIDIRVAPGPKVDQIIHENVDVVICIVGKKLLTKSIITSNLWKRKTNFYGSLCMRELIKKPTLENLLDLSYRFAVDTHIVSPKVLKVIETAREYGHASMCMLGNSLFAIGNTHKLVDVLSKFGRVYVCSIYDKGVHLV